jgi:glycosyltransferase involved in cell wall biosynthesis
MSLAPRKIRLLYVLDSLAIGGAEQLVTLMATSLPPETFHVVVCTLFSRGEKPEPLADELRRAGIRVEQFAMRRWRDLHTMRRFWKLMEEEQIDIVHGHTVPADFWGCLLAKCKRKPALYTRHDRFLRSGPAMRMQRFLLNHVLTDRIVSISQVVATHLIRKRRVPPERITRIPNPVNTDVFHPGLSGIEIRKQLGIPEEAILIGNISRFEPFKGYDFFLDIAFSLVPRHPNAYFLMMGHGSEEDRLKRRVREAGYEGRVVISGPRRDIPQVMAGLDIFLFTSLWGEGFGIVLIEAMASGKPVIAFNAGPAAELIEDGRTGFLPAPETWVYETHAVDIAPVVERLEYLIIYPEIRRIIGEQARRHVVENYSVPRVVEQTAALYRSMLS